MTEHKPVQVRQLRNNLAAYLKQAGDGAEFTIMSRNRVIARLGPPPQRNKRALGLLKGRIWMAPDFDATPDELVRAIEGDGES